MTPVANSGGTMNEMDASTIPFRASDAATGLWREPHRVLGRAVRPAGCVCGNGCAAGGICNAHADTEDRYRICGLLGRRFPLWKWALEIREAGLGPPASHPRRGSS